ncbi:MAG TPA: metalloregulator ArsR/SmtB family transcription factor [Pseudonocardiaceae bacterium]
MNGVEGATAYARWFGCLADPTRVRVLHAIASEPGGVTVGALADRVGIGQSTCSHHVRKLAEVGFVRRSRRGTATVITIDETCRAALPHAAEVVLGAPLLDPGEDPPPPRPAADVTVRALRDEDFDVVRAIYRAGIEGGDATFDTWVPEPAVLDERWLDAHRWVAELGGRLVGWAALSAVSARECYRGVAETAVYVDPPARRAGVGRALLRHTVSAADRSGLWTLQTALFPENRAGIALHRSVGFRTVGIRERIGLLRGRWRDTVMLERRAPAR